MSAVGAKSRAQAAIVVDAVVRGGQSLDAALLSAEGKLPESEWPLLRMLSYGTLRHYFRINESINALLSKPLRKADRVVHALLAIGLFQLTDSRVPDHAAVSLTVEAARRLQRPKLAGLVNACMRRSLRDDASLAGEPTREARWNHPNWIIDALEADWPDDFEAILLANNERAPMWLRANASRTTGVDYQRRLADAGLAANTLDGVVDAVCLEQPISPHELPGFREGDVSVQDAAAQVAARWLLPQSGQHVLDACAAPGGKTGHLLEISGNTLDLVAVDEDPTRLPRIQENLERLKCDATILAADASNPETWWDGRPFDAILLDAPCSATGVVRRHPDIKLLRRPSDIGRLATLQTALLEGLWPLLAVGGRLLYVTCSVMAAENDQIVGAFLKAHADAKENDVLPNNNIHALMRRKACGYQILPGTAGLDGFYFACLEKNAEKQVEKQAKKQMGSQQDDLVKVS